MTLNELGTSAQISVNKLPSPLAAAKHMCARSGWTLTNLQLQKILYLAQMVHLGKKNGERLFDGAFEAWDYGPVSLVIYSQAKIYGRERIRDIFGGGAVDDSERRKMLDDACDQLSKLSAGQLVSMTHSEDGAWARYYRPGVKGIKIPDEAIIDEYRSRTAPK